jgi:hypothetical protein
VTDSSQRPVANLTSADFLVESGGRTIEVSSVERDSAPLAIALVVDQSTSIGFVRSLGTNDRAYYDFARNAVDGLLKASNATDELTLVRVGGPSILVRDSLPHTIGPFMDAVREGVACGRAGSPLWDAIVVAADRLALLQRRRVVIVVTDGQSTGNRISLLDAVNSAVRLQAAVTTIGVRPAQRFRQESGEPELVDPSFSLRRIANATGGHYIAGNTPAASGPPPDPYQLVRRAIELQRQAYLLTVPSEFGSGDSMPKVLVRQTGASTTVQVMNSTQGAPVSKLLTGEMAPQVVADCRR